MSTLNRKPSPRKTSRPQIDEIFRRLKVMHPDAHIELTFSNPLELLIATILSAQCTDRRVNMVTPALFKRFPTAQDYASAPIEEIEQLIASTGFFRQKAKSIQGAAKAILDFGGQVPDEMDRLVTLPGVGRKTANVVLGNAFSKPGLPVDTHVTRLVNRLGITGETDAVKIEFALHELLDPSDWTLFSHTLIFHGRRICVARKPRCAECLLNDICPSAENADIMTKSSVKNGVTKPDRTTERPKSEAGVTLSKRKTNTQRKRI